MNANELAEIQAFKTEELTMWERNHTAAMLRQQQAEMEELEKENTDLRYLIATKLEQQDGISLNSMAHPITNTPEPSYKIDPDKLETIEIDLPSPEPVAWMYYDDWNKLKLGQTMPPDPDWFPVYTHPVKELTDEEIEDECRKAWGLHDQDQLNLEEVFKFARAILRKAQEK